MPNGNGAKNPKVELNLNESATLRLLKDKPYSGENNFGPYYLYSVSHDGVQKAFFTTPDLHQKIAEAGLKTGDEFKISKVAVQNGKKVTAKVEFSVVSKGPSPNVKQEDGIPFEVPQDGYRELMERSLKDAIEATKAVNTVQWSVEDIKSVGLTIFIQRCRS